MKLKLLILFTLIPFLGIEAQNARAILDKAAAAYTKAGGLTASFTLDSKEIKTKSIYSIDGTISMKGDRFKIDIPDATTWFDGKTQWVYMKGTDEVNITEPTGEELQGISPSSIFSIYKQGFDLLYKGEKKVSGIALFEVELISQNKSSNFTKIIVQIDKTTNLFHQIILFDKSGYENKLSIRKMKTNINLLDKTFIFNKSEYPDVEIIDLR